MSTNELTDRERKVLEAVIHFYVESAEPAGSRSIAKKFDLGVSAATIRNTMSDLEDRGYLYHPHASAGRIPTDLAYRVYVDRLMAAAEPTVSERDTLRRELGSDRTAIEAILYKAAQMLGVLTQELGVAVSPSFDAARLERLELVQVAEGRVLMVLVLTGGAARTIFVDVPSSLPREAVAGVALVLNERLSGLSLRDVRATLRERLRDAGSGQGNELINIFIEEADAIFDVSPGDGKDVVLGSAQMLAGQPEFHSNEQMRNLLEITERRDVLRQAMESRRGPGLTVTIGGEHVEPQLSKFTLVTSSYEYGALSGVIGVMGPTRMPYQKVVSLVEHTSRLVGDLLG
jgi:heat-inducible transcriptional repressor